VSPVIGVLLMAVLTVLLASLFAAGVGSVVGPVDDSGVPDESEFPTAADDTTMAANPWAGDRGDLLRPGDPTAGAVDVEYRVNFTVRTGSNTIGNSLNSVYLEVTTDSPDMFSGTAMGDLQRVVVDTDGDGAYERDVTADADGWTVQNGGSALKIGFTGSAYTPDAGDTIVVEFDGVDNPDSAGTYDVRAQTSGDGNWHFGTIEITAD